MKKVFALTILLIVLSTSLVFAKPGGNRLVEDTLEDMQAVNPNYAIDVVTDNTDEVTKINNKKFPGKFNQKHSKEVSSSANAVWVLEDQLTDALDKKSELHKKLVDIAKEKKPVVFVGEGDDQAIANSFDAGIKEIPLEDYKNSARKYKTIATWIRYNDHGDKDLGQVIVPEEYGLKLNTILEATWIYKDGSDVLKQNDNIDDNSLSAALFRKGIALAAPSTSISESYDDNWKWRRDYIVYIADIPYGKINLAYKFYELDPDGTSYDWFSYDYSTQIVPGTATSDTNYKEYALDKAYTLTYSNYYTNPDQIMYRYGPGNVSSSSSTAGISVGTSKDVKGAAIDAGFQYTWPINDLAVSDWSDNSLQKENHKWDFNERSTGRNTNWIAPAVDTRLSQGQNGYEKHYKSFKWYNPSSGIGDIDGYYNNSWFFADNIHAAP